MGKSDLIKEFGSQANFAKFMGVKPVAICMLKEELTQRYKQNVLGRFLIYNREIPASWLKDARKPLLNKEE